jgi:hypothetical protein
MGTGMATQQLGRAMRHQDEDRPGGGLLEAFEERVGRVLVHVLGGVHESHPRPAAVRANVEKPGELAHLVDLDLDARLLGLPGRSVVLGVGWRELR